MSVTEGQSTTTLQCPGSGGDVEWKYQRSIGSTETTVIASSSSGERFLLDKANSLTILNIAVDDSGLYQCIQHGRIKRTFTVTVKSRSKSTSFYYLFCYLLPCLVNKRFT